MKKPLAVIALLAAVAAGSSVSLAEDLADVLPGFLFIELEATGHEAHFRNTEAGIRTVGALDAAIASQFANYPLGSSSGSLTYSFDPALGVAGRNSQTLGSEFGERALTLGRKKWNAGLRYLHTSVDSIDDLDAGNGSLVIQLEHGNVPGDNSFEGDLIQARFHLDLKLDTALLFASYGVTDRLDVGLALPVVRADLGVRADETIDHQSTDGDEIHCFISGTGPDPACPNQRTVRSSATATGIGDIVARARYNFFRGKKVGVSGAIDVKFPTGKEEDFLGTGVTQAKLFFVCAGELGRFSPYANLGYAVSSGSSSVSGDVPDEIDYLAGFNVAIHRRWTISVDAIGRMLRDAQRVEVNDRTYKFATMDGGPIFTDTHPTLETSRDNVNSLQGALGVKFNPSGGLLISAGALIPLNDEGLRNNITFIAGVDWTY